MIDRIFRKFLKKDNEEEPRKITALELGKVDEINWDLVSFSKEEVINTRIGLMMGSFGGSPGLMVSIMNEFDKTDKKVLTLEETHDILVDMLKIGGLENGIMRKGDVDAALRKYWETNE